MPDDARPASGSGDRVEMDVNRGSEAAEAQAFVRHELRTPLAVLQPVLDMLLDGTAGELVPRHRDYVAMLERNVTRLSGMITSLVETGWLEIAQVPAREERVELAPLLRDLTKRLAAQLDAVPRVEVREHDARNVAGKGSVARGSAVAVVTDPHRLRLALRNILVNACRFTPPTGSVLVTVSGTPDGRALVEVADSGLGIPADELAHVCELGYQGGAAQDLPDRGLGLGLAVAQALLQGGGGSLTIRSVAGRGTTVVVDLPADPA